MVKGGKCDEEDIKLMSDWKVVRVMKIIKELRMGVVCGMVYKSQNERFGYLLPPNFLN